MNYLSFINAKANINEEISNTRNLIYCCLSERSCSWGTPERLDVH